jgi:hypothetical protein
MRLIPHFHTIISTDSKVKCGTLVARQEALNCRLAYSNSILMSITSTVYENTLVFHTIDKVWKDGGVTFTFVPKNESDGRMYVAGLIPYLRSINPWYLSCFTEDARYLHCLKHWDPHSKQVLTSDELGMGDNNYIDDNLNYSNEPTNEPTAVCPISNTMSAYIEVLIPEVGITGAVPPLLQETDSGSTFQ